MRLHKQEKATQRAAQRTGYPTTVGWRYYDPEIPGEVLVQVRAKKKLIGYEMRYWIGVDRNQKRITRKELIAWMQRVGV